MKIHGVSKGRTVKVVRVIEVAEVDDKAVTDFAIEGAGEKMDSLFGTHVVYYEDDKGTMTAVVDLYTA